MLKRRRYRVIVSHPTRVQPIYTSQSLSLCDARATRGILERTGVAENIVRIERVIP